METKIYKKKEIKKEEQMCKNVTQVLQWCNVTMNRKVRNKRRPMGTKVKLHDKKEHCVKEKTTEKTNHK